MKYIIELETDKVFNEFACNQNSSDDDYCKENQCPFYCNSADPYEGGCSLEYENFKIKVTKENIESNDCLI